MAIFKCSVYNVLEYILILNFLLCSFNIPGTYPHSEHRDLFYISKIIQTLINFNTPLAGKTNYKTFHLLPIIFQSSNKNSSTSSIKSVLQVTKHLNLDIFHNLCIIYVCLMKAYANFITLLRANSLKFKFQHYSDVIRYSSSQPML